MHGNRHRQPAHALTPADVTRAVQFIGNYAEDHGILLPGRIPGYKRCDLQLLPSNSTKKSVWELYVAATETLPIRVTSYRAFLLIWKKYLPHIVIIKPMSDLCWVCQQNTNKIMRNINRTEEEKSQVRITFMCIK